MFDVLSVAQPLQLINGNKKYFEGLDRLQYSPISLLVKTVHDLTRLIHLIRTQTACRVKKSSQFQENSSYREPAISSMFFAAPPLTQNKTRITFAPQPRPRVARSQGLSSSRPLTGTELK